MMQTFVIIYFTLAWPYVLPKDNMLEVFNQCAVMFCAYFELVYMDEMVKQETRFIVGYW